MSAPRISIVIPTRNGAATLPALLDALWTQQVSGGIEIIAVDSGSTDGTIEILTPRVTTLIQIGPDDFDHGATRNLAVGRARGELVALLVQDAVPASPHWLDALTRPFVSQPALAGTFSRQQPRPDASAITRHYLRTWVASSQAAWTSTLPGGRRQFDQLTPAERFARCAFDNVASCIRRSVWESAPFKPTPIAEDLEWARDVLCQGHAIAFVPDAVVTHSHERPAAYELARTRLVHARLCELFGLATIPSLSSLARAILSSLLLHLRLEWRAPRRWPRAVALAVAWPLGQFLGARDARTGATPRRPRAGTV